MTQHKNVPNCGIIFLHVYLSQLFRNEELLVNQQFKNRDCQIKAIQLLYFLSTSKQDFSDQVQIEFFKIIVGIDKGNPINFLEELQQSSIENCQSLLQAFISNWSVVKNMSIEGIQNSFLKRDGFVIEKENQLEIQLETNTSDILLNQLPYNFSLVKLPWLKTIIKTII